MLNAGDINRVAFLLRYSLFFTPLNINEIRRIDQSLIRWLRRERLIVPKDHHRPVPDGIIVTKTQVLWLQYVNELIHE